MKSQPVSHSETYRPSIIKGILIRVGEILSGFMVMGATLFMAAGRVNWAWGWIMLGIYLASVGVNGIFTLRIYGYGSDPFHGCRARQLGLGVDHAGNLSGERWCERHF